MPGYCAKRPLPPVIYSLLLAVIGIALLIQGGVLLGLGGSPYYAVAGALTLGAAVLLALRSGWGSWLFAAMILGTLAWALAEAGTDGWALAPRLIGPAVVGLWLLAPWTVRGLNAPAFQGRELSRRAGGFASLAVLVAFAVCAVLPNGLSVSAPAAHPVQASADGSAADWLHYGGDAGGSRFSQLSQITPQNVSKLAVAWTFRTGPTPKGLAHTFEVNPLKVGDSVYLCDGANRVFALDAETGRLRWKYDPKPNIKGVTAGTCRGVAYFRAPALAAGAPCAERIIGTTIDARLYAVDARTGLLCQGFGVNGAADMKAGLGEHIRGYYEITSAPTVVRGKVVVGGWISDNEMLGEPSGVVRAFDANTGAFAWAWDIDRPGQHGQPAAGQSYSKGTPNSWAPASADEALGLVFLPTGNATPDYWGGTRSKGAEQYASSVVAVDAMTGEPRWSFQTVHHDLWDYDVNSQPTLADIDVGHGLTPALIQATKRGQIFILDRRTGVPLTKVEEQPAPGGAAAGDRTSPTQPYSTDIPSFGGPPLKEADMWGVTPFDQLWCRIAYRRARYDGPFTPPGLKPTIEYPGFKGGVGWGGVAIDADRQIMIVNSTRIATYDRLLPRAAADAMGIRPRGMGGKPSRITAQAGTPFAIALTPFLSPLGAPCQEPPYGLISAVDLRTHRLLWSKPFGTARDSGPLGIESQLPFAMGTPNDGGAVVTRSGLTFIGATQERALRAIDTASGRILWKARLPAGPQATPMTYVSPASGRQFLVLAAGGHPSLKTKPGDYIIAYALPAGHQP